MVGAERVKRARILGEAVRFSEVKKEYGGVVAVSDVDLDIAAGEFLTLLGPSGSGKTTTLMMLAGFEMPTAGDIFVGTKCVTEMLPAKRNIGMVFQSYALFPHMTVFENIAFPLKMRGKSAAEQKTMVERVLKIVDLAGMSERYPRQLSGGQQQRVALARAIVFEPPVLLMDEPLSALDKYLRSHLQTEIKRIQRELGITVVYVTHDQDEAMTMSDRICVMHQGTIRQLGSPESLYQHPTDEFVAGFLGEANMLNATVETETAGTATIRIGGGRATLPVRAPANGQLLKVSIRPEHIDLAPTKDERGDWTIATVEDVTYVGDHRRYALRLANGDVLSAKRQIVDTDRRFAAGDRVHVRWPVEHMRIFADGASLS